MSFVDDELPDYIMVMVANKKSKAHMTEDLNLFLGNNTDRFTTWYVLPSYVKAYKIAQKA